MTSLAVQKGPDSAVGGGKQPLAPPVSPSPRRLPHPRPSPHLPHPLNRPPWRGLAPSPGRRSGLGCPRAHAHLLSWPFGGLQRGQASLWVEWERPEDTSLPSDRVSVPALLLPAGSGGHSGNQRVFTACTPFCEVLGGSSSQYCTFTVCGRQRSASWIL